MAKPMVALVGRPNVGKSTLFNRLAGRRIAIVDEIAGTTRDRLYAPAEWTGHEFMLIDTGGLESELNTDISRRIREQANLAIAEADIVVFMVDGREGLTATDQEIADLLRQSKKPVILAANKADNQSRMLDAVEFYELGLGDITPISAHHGMGTGDLLDLIVEQFPKGEAEEEIDGIGISIVGRPNVGKSSILNAIIGKDRSIVSSVPGTTRDVIDTTIEYNSQHMTLLDTAGIRRRGRVEVGIEKYSVIRALRAIDRADITLLIIDASEGITAQDTHLAGYVRDAHKGVAIIVNKWDLLTPKTPKSRTDFTEKVRYAFNFMPYAPILFTSAKNGSGIKNILGTAETIWESRNQRIPTARLNTIIRDAFEAHSPGSVRGRKLKLFYVTQSNVNPPTIVFFVNDPVLLHFSFQRYLENQLRESLPFVGTPIKMVFRPNSERAYQGDEKK